LAAQASLSPSALLLAAQASLSPSALLLAAQASLLAAQASPSLLVAQASPSGAVWPLDAADEPLAAVAASNWPTVVLLEECESPLAAASGSAYASATAYPLAEPLSALPYALQLETAMA
jgi:hypothetical protein